MYRPIIGKQSVRLWIFDRLRESHEFKMLEQSIENGLKSGERSRLNVDVEWCWVKFVSVLGLRSNFRVEFQWRKRTDWWIISRCPHIRRQLVDIGIAVPVSTQFHRVADAKRDHNNAEHGDAHSDNDGHYQRVRCVDYLSDSWSQAVCRILRREADWNEWCVLNTIIRSIWVDTIANRTCSRCLTLVNIVTEFSITG